MKDLFQVFDENFDMIQRLLDQQNLAGCSSISTDLITISRMSNFEDGVFIGEVFESVFDQVSPLFDQYEIKAEDRDSMMQSFKEQVALTQKLYKDQDKTELYNSLKKLRNVATEFQFKCWRTMKLGPAAKELRALMRGRREYHGP